MPEVKTPQVAAVPLPERPDDDGDASHTLEQSTLINGYILGRYSGTGALVARNLADMHRSSVKNAYPIQCFTTCFPHVITIHQNEVLQVFNLQTTQCDSYQQEAGLLEGVRRVLANSLLIVGIAPKKIIIWQRRSMTTEAPRIIDTSGAPKQIVSTSEMSAFIGDTRLVLVNTNPNGHLFQVWDLATGELAAYSENLSKVETFFAFGCNAEGIVAGACREGLYLWNTSGTPGAVNADFISKYEGRLLTSVFVDSHMILVGDNFGGITLNTNTGRLLFHLNRVKKDADSLDLQSTQITQLTNVFRAKINKIIRVGRWVFAACEDSCIKVFDIFSPSLTAPCDVFTHPTAGTSMRDICVVGRTVYALAVYPVDAKSKSRPRVDLVTWTPKLENESLGTPGYDAICHASPVTLICQACSVTKTTIEKNKAAFRPEDFTRHLDLLTCCCNDLSYIEEAQERQGIALPFLLCQSFQVALDRYDSVLAKVTKGSKGPKGSKHREMIEEEHKNLKQARKLLLSCAVFLGDIEGRGGDGKSRTGSVSDFPHFDDLSGSGRSDDLSGRSGSHKKGRGRAASSAKVGGSESAGDGVSESGRIENMLNKVVDDLGSVEEQIKGTIADFDKECNAGVPDPDMITPLLSVYTKLRQLHEDLKETGKEIGEFLGENTSGEWWAGGGDYDEGGSAAN